MEHPWMPDEPGDDELERLFASQREAWRGDADGDGDGDAEPWAAPEPDETWRGSEHLADWPEASAGPEYWMYKLAAGER